MKISTLIYCMAIFICLCFSMIPIFGGAVDITPSYGLPIEAIQKTFIDSLIENVCIRYFLLMVIGGEFAKKININIPTFIKIGIFGLVSGLLAYLFTPCKNGFHLFFTFSFAVVCYEFILSQVYKYLKQFNVL